MMERNETFRVAISRDFLTPEGKVGWGDIGLELLDARPDVSYEFLPDDEVELSASTLQGYDGLLLLLPRLTGTSLRGADRLKVVARFGVGYDNVDIQACAEAGVAVTITPDGVRRPVAVSALTLLLAVLHRVRQKDSLVRSGGWERKLDFMGTDPTGKAIGIVGWGNIGRELSRLVAPLEMRQMASDPFADPTTAREAGVELVGIDELVQESDVVVLTCALTPSTHHLIDADRLAAMRPTAYLVNVARGPIVDQAALTDALQHGAIAGAALDVFDPEPPGLDDPLLQLDNVLLAPHAIAWTDGLAKGNGSSAIRAILDVADGHVPDNVVDATALDHPRLAGLTHRPHHTNHH